MGAVMQEQLRKLSILAAMTWTIVTLAGTDATALTYNDIYGKWCSSGGSEHFAQHSLTVVRASDGARIVFRIDSYEFSDTRVTVNWIDAKKKKVFTEFGEFSSDGERMVQLPNENGPRRLFQRC